MSSNHRQGQLSRGRDLRHFQSQESIIQFEAYLKANPIFTAELVTQPPADALMLPMGYELEGLYRYPLGQGVVYLDAWQLQQRAVQPSAHKPPPRKRRKADEYTTLIVQSRMKEKPSMIPDIEDLRAANEARAFQQAGPFPPQRHRAELGDDANIMSLIHIANTSHEQAKMNLETELQALRIIDELRQQESA